MKKNLLLLLVSLVAVSASAQKKFTFGPKAGLSIADLHVDDEKQNDAVSGIKAGFVVGAFAEYRAIKWFAVSADVLFAQKGSMNENTISAEGVEVTTKNNYKLSYIDVPVLANFYVTKGLALKAGIQPSFLAGAKCKVTQELGSQTNDETVDLKKEMKSVDFSIPVGVAYTFKMGLVVDLRYHISCTNLLKEGDYKLTNRVATLTVGWKF